MKKSAYWLVLLSVLFLYGCNQRSLEPKELARHFQVCYRYQSSGLPIPAVCENNKVLFSIMKEELQQLSSRLDLGMKIAASQQKLAILKQEFSAKGLSTEAKKLISEKIFSVTQRILALKAIFFLSQSL
jgi:hypothetical protein